MTLFRDYLPLENGMAFIWTSLNPLYLRMFCGVSRLVEIGPVVLKKIFKLRTWIFAIYLPCWKVGSFIWTSLSTHHPKMPCAKFGWNWPCGSGKDENGGQTDGKWTTHKRRSENLTWAFSSNELKKLFISF